MKKNITKKSVSVILGSLIAVSVGYSAIDAQSPSELYNTISSSEDMPEQIKASLDIMDSVDSMGNVIDKALRKQNNYGLGIPVTKDTDNKKYKYVIYDQQHRLLSKCNTLHVDVGYEFSDCEIGEDLVMMGQPFFYENHESTDQIKI